MLLTSLFLIILFTRFKKSTKSFSKFIEILFIFYLISIVIRILGIDYPESLIIVLSILVILIFLEGPEWSRLFFHPGQTKAHFKLSLFFTLGSLLAYGIFIYFRKTEIRNPVPLGWPIDTLIIIGFGLAIFLAIIEEILFRSFIFERMASATNVKIAIPLQGLFYGFLQYRIGIPNGNEGIIFGSLFGMGLAYLVYKTNSIYLSMLVHFMVTLGIFWELTILG